TAWWDVIDEFRQVTDKDAMTMARGLAREEGIFVGGSGGMNVHIALAVAREVDDPNACVVTVLCDTGERYLAKIFNGDWMRENQLLASPSDTAASLLKRRDTEASQLVEVAPAAQLRQALTQLSTYDVS